MEYVIVKARQRGNYAANTTLKLPFIFMDSFLSIIIICAISNISTSTSIQLFSEEGIIHRLGEGFYQHKIL